MTRALAGRTEDDFLADADHGFLAYTRPYYRAADAQLAWKRTVGFLERHL